MPVPHRPLFWTVAAVSLSLLPLSGCSDQGTIAPTAVVSADISLAPQVVAFQALDEVKPLEAELRTSDGRRVVLHDVVWRTLDPSVALVDTSGLVRATGNGQTGIVVTAGNGRADTATVVVSQQPTDVSIAPKGLQFRTLGDTARLKASVKDKRGYSDSQTSVTWQTLDAAVATVDGTGLVRSVAPGQTAIVATAGAKADTASVAVAQQVAAIAVSPRNGAFSAVGDTLRLQGVATDAAGIPITDPGLTWSSRDASVATVDASGLVRSAGNGTTYVVASAGGKTDSASISVKQVPSSLEIAPASVTLASVGAAAQFAATARDRNGAAVPGVSVSWTSSAAAVATVDGTGRVVAVAPGNASVRAMVDGLPAATATVEVKLTGGSIQVSPSSANLTPGATISLSATLLDASGNAVSAGAPAWSSSAPAVASVSSSGTVTALATGTATITAAINGQSGTATITVSTATSTVASVEVSPSAPTLSTGGSVQLTATPKDAAGKAISGRTATWSSSNAAVAKVSSTGMVTGVAPGTAVMTATVDGKSGSAKTTVATQIVVAPVATVTVAPNAATLSVGGTVALAATTRDASGNVLTDRTVTWTSANPAVAAVNVTGIVTGLAAGTTTITATVDGTSGSATAMVSAPVQAAPSSWVAPELPRVYVDTRVPSVTGRVISVAAGGDLQAALNTAQPGDAVELAAGATYTGNFKLPAKGGSSYIVIRSSGWTSLPPEGTRVGPAQASLMAKIVSPNVMPAITNATAAGYYRLVGLEITSAPTSTSYAYSLVALSTENATSLAQYPHHIVIDRSYVHGTPTLGLQRCVTLNAAYAAVVDSYLSECHYAGNDSQAIVAWDTPGPLKIVNNYLEGAGENVMIGGAGTKVAGLVPADVEIRRNHFRKPTSWIGSQWTIKNLFETKNVRRILVEGNVFENNWAQAQQGTAIVLKSNGEGGSPQAVLEDLTFRYNIIRNSPKGVNIIGTQENYGSAAGTYTPPTNKRILLQHNLFDNVGDASMPGGNQPWIFMLYRGGEDITIDHNTVASGGTSTFVMFSGTETGTRLHFTNNIGDLGSYGIRGDGSIPTAGEGTAAFDAYAPGWTVAGNVLGLGNHKTSLYPTGNYWPTSRDALGLAGGALPAGSPYAGKATDASNPGADIPTLTAKTTGVK